MRTVLAIVLLIVGLLTFTMASEFRLNPVALSEDMMSDSEVAEVFRGTLDQYLKQEKKKSPWTTSKFGSVPRRGRRAQPASDKKFNLNKVGDIIKKADKIRAIIKGEQAETESDLVNCFCVRAPCNCGNVRSSSRILSEKVDWDKVKNVIQKGKQIRDVIKKKKSAAVVEESDKFNWDVVADVIKKAEQIRSIIQDDQVEQESDSMGSQSGGASYYADYFNGRKTASGEIFSNSASTCAHKTLPFGTRVTVRNVANGKTTTCRVNDRGPYASGRVIDLTRAVFSKLAPISQGVMNVQISY